MAVEVFPRNKRWVCLPGSPAPPVPSRTARTAVGLIYKIKQYVRTVKKYAK